METHLGFDFSKACLEAPEIRLGGIGNQLLRILRESTPGRAYHLLRDIFGTTRPMPTPPGPEGA
jgi:hypothetical protein